MPFELLEQQIGNLVALAETILITQTNCSMNTKLERESYFRLILCPAALDVRVWLRSRDIDKERAQFVRALHNAASGKVIIDGLEERQAFELCNQRWPSDQAAKLLKNYNELYGVAPCTTRA